MKWVSSLLYWLSFLFIIYAGLTIYGYFFVNDSIFLPPKVGYKDSSHIIKIATNNGAVISAVYLPKESATYTVLINHGNAEDLEHIMPFLQRFREKGFAIFAYDYQGYGTSTGKATEQNVYLDVNAAYAYLTQQLHIPPQQIIVYGRSLGAALAIDLAARKPVAGVIIESPFLSAYRALTQIPLFLFDKFNNLAKIKNIKSPILVIHGTKDEYISFWQGKKLYREANSPKSFLWVKGAGHNNVLSVDENAYWGSINKFAYCLQNICSNYRSP